MGPNHAERAKLSVASPASASPVLSPLGVAFAAKNKQYSRNPRQAIRHDSVGASNLDLKRPGCGVGGLVRCDHESGHLPNEACARICEHMSYLFPAGFSSRGVGVSSACAMFSATISASVSLVSCDTASTTMR